MQFNTKAVVTGVKFFKDSIEGTAYDKTTVFIQMPLDDSRGNGVGFATQAVEWGKSDEFHKVKHLPFPVECELTMELVTSGKAQKQRVVALKPLQQVKAGAAS